MSIKTRNEAQRRADEEALRAAAMTNLKRECARELVPILRLIKQQRWVEASVAVDEYLAKPVDKLITDGFVSSSRYHRQEIFFEALKLRQLSTSRSSKRFRHIPVRAQQDRCLRQQWT